MVVTGVVLALRGDGGARGLGSRIAIIEVKGLIDDDIDVLDEIRSFRRDGSVAGFVVDINSPGGVVGPSQSIYRELRRLREDGYPVVATIGAVGASGGYYVALAADSILALPGTITGSIGVILEFPDASELLDKVGLDMQTVKSAEHKDIGSPFRTMGEGDRALLDSLVQDVYGQFVDVVAGERGLDRATVLRVADGRIVSGQQAVAWGLIDGLGNRTDAIAMAGRMAGLGSEPRVAWPPEDRPTLLDVLLARTPVGALQRLMPAAGFEGPRLRYGIPW